MSSLSFAVVALISVLVGFIIGIVVMLLVGLAGMKSII